MDRLISYQLTIQLYAPVRLQIGALGQFELPEGDYIYTGSAKKNRAARISRHLKKNKSLHWHIDYLLALPESEIIKIEFFAQSECDLNQRTEGRIIVPGFGASDCQKGCGAHFKLIRY